MDADDGGEVSVSEGERVAKFRREETIEQGGYIH
jgi:hypothetical protein